MVYRCLRVKDVLWVFLLPKSSDEAHIEEMCCYSLYSLVRRLMKLSMLLMQLYWYYSHKVAYYAVIQSIELLYHGNGVDAAYYASRGYRPITTYSSMHAASLIYMYKSIKRSFMRCISIRLRLML